MPTVEEIEGIGPAYAAKLKAAGVTTEESLLKTGASKKGRQDLAEKSAISETLILEWVNRADLSRIKGVGSEYSDLLEASGVDSVPELAQRNGPNLHKKMVEINAAKNLVRVVPSDTSISDWIEQAKKLDRVVTH